MLSFMLLFAGICTFFNGLALLNILSSKDLRYLNLFVALLQTLTLVFMFVHGDLEGPLMPFYMTSTTLFIFTYAYIAATNFGNLNTRGLSLYCGIVAVIAFIFAFINLIQLGDLVSFINWMQWSVLWAFFCLIDFKPCLLRFTGWLAAVIAWSSLIIPSFLQLTLLWSETTSYIYFASVLIVIAFIIIYPILTLMKRKTTI